MMTLTQSQILERTYRGKSTTERFFDKVKKAKNGCWLWTGSMDINGYGRLRIANDAWGAHRLSWTITNGDVPDNLYVLHKCDVRHCVNPAHLFLGTYSDNLHDAMAKGRWTPQRGSTVGNSKLNEAQVIRLRHLYAETDVSQKELAQQFSVGENCIGHIIAGRQWKHAGGPVGIKKDPYRRVRRNNA